MAGELFGTTSDGEEVQRFAIRGGGLTAHVIGWGAVLQDLRLDGHDAPLVLGFDRFADYPAHSPHFGAIAGRYATPLVVPPTVAILGCGKVRRDVVATDAGPAIHRRIPLSLTFDHRCITGGEALRFLAAVIQDLELST